MKKCLDILEKEYTHYEDVVSDLVHNFYPECEIIETPQQSGWVKGNHKYDWYGKIVFKYFGQLYLVDLVATGNGGWLSIDECKVNSILPIKSVYYETVQVKKYVV